MPGSGTPIGASAWPSSRALRLDEKLLKRSIQNDVDQALVALRAARENYALRFRPRPPHKKTPQKPNVLYQQALARAIEVNDANDKLFEADVTREAAKLSMEQAYLTYGARSALGPLDQDKGVPAP